MQASYGKAGVDQSTLELVIDQIEELVVTLIEEIRERPAVAAAILAGVVGAMIGGMLAAGFGRPKPVKNRVVKRVHRMGDMAELAGLGFKLLENPIVRSYALAAVSAQLRKRMKI
ncbi:MAG TPA: hypothetical protein VGL99_17080 [Chloroflexota bacterium]|jgi:uncharacterized membrane protein YeaQ/YmgE (transglycosylase-associated protein family)